MLRLLTAVIVAMLFVLTGCSDQGSGGLAGPGKGVSPDDLASPGDDSSQDASEGSRGLCSWASQESLEAVFDGPVELSSGLECRVVPSSGQDAKTIYHFAVEQQRSFDQLHDALLGNADSLGEFSVCHDEQGTWEGMRTVVSVTCPTGSSNHQPVVSLELGDGRVLTSMPLGRPDKASAVAAGERFLEIFKVYAKQMDGLPMINEWKPGEWVEIYNPGEKPLDLSGYTLELAKDIDTPTTAVKVADGTSLAPGQRVVVDVSEAGNTALRLGLVDQQLRPADNANLISALDPDEVIRRNGDGGTYCAGGVTKVTKGKANPASAEYCLD